MQTSLLNSNIVSVLIAIILNQFQEGSLKSAFEGFTGFNTTPVKNAPFSFLAGVSPNTTVNTTETTANSKNVASNGATKPTENDPTKIEETFKSQTTPGNTSAGKQASIDQIAEKTKKHSSDYHTRLKGLNESVAQWIKSHVDSNPFCILTPIFKDYERYLKEIVSKEKSTKTQTTLHTTEHTTKVAQNDNKKDESTEKKPDNLFGGNTNVTAKSPSGGTEWKPEKSVFSNITPSTKSIFGAPVFGNLESNTSSKSIFANMSAENNPFLQQKLSVVSDSKVEEVQTKSDSKPAAPTFPSSTFSFGQSSATSNATAGFSFGRYFIHNILSNH